MASINFLRSVIGLGWGAQAGNRLWLGELEEEVN